MNIQERENLDRFLQQLVQAKAGSKDIDADRLIQEACRSQSDAHYLLVQRSLLLEHALEDSQAEIARLRKELESQRSPVDSFLDNSAWGNTPAQSPAPQRASSDLPSATAPAAPMNSHACGSGLMGTVAATAAGVVAGSFLFQGIEHLMGNHNSQSGFLSGSSPLHSTPPSESVAANNFHDSGSNADDLSSLGPGDGDPDWV